MQVVLGIIVLAGETQVINNRFRRNRCFTERTVIRLPHYRLRRIRDLLRRTQVIIMNKVQTTFVTIAIGLPSMLM